MSKYAQSYYFCNLHFKRFVRNLFMAVLGFSYTGLLVCVISGTAHISFFRPPDAIVFIYSARELW